jgi:hypothetical protein
MLEALGVCHKPAACQSRCQQYRTNGCSVLLPTRNCCAIPVHRRLEIAGATGFADRHHLARFYRRGLPRLSP